MQLAFDAASQASTQHVTNRLNAPRAACHTPGTELRGQLLTWSELVREELIHVHPLKLLVGQNTSSSQSCSERLWRKLSPVLPCELNC